MVRVAATQMNCVADSTVNVSQAEKLVREAAAQGAEIILLQELFHTLYFCQVISQVSDDLKVHNMRLADSLTLFLLLNTRTSTHTHTDLPGARPKVLRLGRGRKRQSLSSPFF
jgi:predicted amidohydrolase